MQASTFSRIQDSQIPLNPSRIAPMLTPTTRHKVSASEASFCDGLQRLRTTRRERLSPCFSLQPHSPLLRPTAFALTTKAASPGS
jgi:hypothetical protein